MRFYVQIKDCLHYLQISKKQILLMDPDQAIALTHRKNH